MPLEEMTYRENVMHKLDDLKVSVLRLDEKLTYTNGKVRKLIIAVIAIGCLLIGYASAHFPELMPLILKFI